MQVALVRADALSPWLGGGFGMFSTTDNPANRALRVALVGARGSRPLALPASFDLDARRLRALPSHGRLLALARRVARELGGAVPELSEVRVEVWRTRFDPAALAPRSEPLRRLELAWPPDG